MYALPVIRYLPGIVSWSQVEIDATDVKTKKILTKAQRVAQQVQHPEQ